MPTPTTELRPPQTIDPKPRLTHDLDVGERLVAATLEAQELLQQHLGDLPADPQQAWARGLLVSAIATAIGRAEARGTRPREVPQLIEVFDVPPGDDTPRHGLQCPHCGTVAWDGGPQDLHVIDVSERWSRFGYEVGMTDEWEPVEREVPRYPGGPLITVTDYRRTGRQVEHRAIRGGYASPDHQGEGYACTDCWRRVALPEGVEEEGN